jgi:hypothetical protein
MKIITNAPGAASEAAFACDRSQLERNSINNIKIDITNPRILCVCHHYGPYE